jgi:hypothetical protein
MATPDVGGTAPRSEAMTLLTLLVRAWPTGAVRDLSSAGCRRTGSVLEGGDEGEGGLGARVEVGSVQGQLVVTAAGCRVPHGVLMSFAPRNQSTDRRTPASQIASPVMAAAVAQASASAATSIGC